MNNVIDNKTSLEVMQGVASWAIGLSADFALIVIGYGILKYLLAKSEEEKKRKAKKIIFYGFLLLVVMMVIYSIITSIEVYPKG